MTRALPRRAIRLAAAVLIGALAAGLAGCGVLYGTYTNYEREGGIPAGEAVAALEAVPGVDAARFTTVPWSAPGEGGLGADAGMDLVLEVAFDPDLHLADPAAALDALVGLAWSINADYPKGRVHLALQGGVAANHDWTPLLAERFESARSIATPEPPEGLGPATLVDWSRSSVLLIGVRSVADRLGAWPADPPERLDLVLAEGPPEIVLGAALTSASLSWFATLTRDERCWIAYAGRADGPDGEYAGPVRVVITGPEGAVLVDETSESSLVSIRRCDIPEPADASRWTATFTTDGDGVWFAPTTLIASGALAGR